MAISNRVGPPVTGDDFYGRTAELALAHEYLDSNHSLSLSAPRRIGKSSFAKRLIADKKKLGWKCVYIDLEGILSKEEFLQTLINNFEASGIWTEAVNVTGSLVNRILEGIKGIGPVEVDFSKQENPKNPYISLSKVIDHSTDTLIVIDELTLFLSILDKHDETHQEAAFFLNWFRSIRQISDSHIRWIFCGSVGLHNFTSIRNLSMSINDLVPFDFDALSYDEANGLINALAESEHIQFSPQITTYILDRIEWHIPYFIQLFFTNIKTNKDVKNGITKQMVDTVFDKLIHTREIFNTWSERLVEYYDHEFGARLLLKELSKSLTGLTRDQLLAIHIQYTGDSPFKADYELSTILDMMEHDGYIIRVNGGIRRFRSPLLKMWWYYNFAE